MPTCIVPVAPLPAVTPAGRLFARVIQHDDARAFSQLFSCYYTPLVRRALSYVGTREVAEEVVSDVFMKLWRNRAQIQIHTSFLGYMYRAVRNQSLDYRKSTARLADTHDLLTATQHSLACSGATPEAAAVENDLRRHLETAVQRLPRQCQLIFRLSREEGLGYREIAERLDLSVKTVETHMGRALKALRHHVNPCLQEART